MSLLDYSPLTCPLPWHGHLTGVWYLASPYSAHPGGFEQAFEDANRAAGVLLTHGVHVISPISHSHPIASACNMDLSSHDLWMPLDLAILSGTRGVLINPIPGWRLSKGIAMEVAEAHRLGLPVYKLKFDW